MRQGLAVFVTLLSFLLASMGVQAAETTSAIRGKVVGANGAAMSNATVVVEDQRTGARRTFTTNEVGTFLAPQLAVGGPYKLTVNSTKSVTVESISLGDIYNVTINVGGAAQMEELVVYGESGAIIDVASGPSAAFSTYDLETSPSFNRDIQEVYSLDPRVNLDNDDDGFEINCGGKHPRFNSMTLDGVGLNDLFGLNSNGYSTAVEQPFPYDAIRQVAVELAPFDVTYGGFSACNVNAVTKSGGNEWDGNVFYEYTSDSLRGDKIADDPRNFSTPAYTQKKYGFTVGGPILQDQLFIFGAYEMSERPRFLARGYDGSGNGDERSWLSKADYDRIVSIANNVYGYDPGGQPGDGIQEAEKYMVRADWYPTDDHKLAVIYSYTDQFQDRDSDGDSYEFEFANHFYVKGAEQEVFTVKLESQWSDALSTEFFYSNVEMVDSQVTKGPKDFGDFQIDVGSNVVYLGADDSRQANALNWQADYLRLNTTYLMGDHVITAGYERVDLEIFNKFVQHSRGGEWDFYGVDDRDGDGLPEPAYCSGLTAAGRYADAACDLSPIDQFELGRPSQLYYGSGGGTNNPDDAAANFTYATNSLYIQDELYLPGPSLTVVGGLRYDWLTSSDNPVYNANFAAANGGLRNDANIDGIDLLMPRLGFTWDVRGDLSLRGGLGLYSGGNPNVWISNAWSNDGITNVQVRIRNFDASRSVLDGTIPLTGTRPGIDIPQELFDEVAATTAASGSTRRLVLLDPNLEQPAEWKLAIGGTYFTPWSDIVVDADYLYTKQKDPVIYVDISQTVVGTTAAGQPIYDYTNGSDNYMLTNARDEGKSHMFSFVVRKSFDWGLDLQGGYAYTQSEDVNPMTSSVAFSNFTNLATNDINNPGVGDSNYVVPHRFTFRASYSREFIDGLATRVTLYGYAQQGQPGSYVFDTFDMEGSRSRRHPLYIPDGAGDPNVVFAPGFDQGAFFSWAQREDLRPGFQPRNGFNADWRRRIDLRFDQELPTFFEGSKGKLFVKIYNLGNFLNDDWGKQTDANFFSTDVVDMSLDAQGRYVFERFSDRTINDVLEGQSLYEIRLGLEINF
jgi:hypothetical protein